MNETNSKQLLNWETRPERIQKNDMRCAAHFKYEPYSKMSDTLKYSIKYSRYLVSQFNTHFDIIPTQIVHVVKSELMALIEYI